MEHPDVAFDSPSTGRTGCDFLTGDYVVDTPAAGMNSATYCAAILGLAPNAPCCPIGSDTCPHCPGEDPVTNFMSYSSDCCTNSFTDGQIIRMQHSWQAYCSVGQVAGHSVNGTEMETASSAAMSYAADIGFVAMFILAGSFYF